MYQKYVEQVFAPFFFVVDTDGHHPGHQSVVYVLRSGVFGAEAFLTMYVLISIKSKVFKVLMFLGNIYIKDNVSHGILQYRTISNLDFKSLYEVIDDRKRIESIFESKGNRT